MTVRLYKVLSSSSVVSALGSELDDLGSSPGWGKALCPWDVREKKMWALLLGLAKSIYYWCLLKIYIQESHIQSESSHLLHSFLNDTVLCWSIRSFNIPTPSPFPPHPSLGNFLRLVWVGGKVMLLPVSRIFLFLTLQLPEVITM